MKLLLNLLIIYIFGIFSVNLSFAESGTQLEENPQVLESEPQKHLIDNNSFRKNIKVWETINIDLWIIKDQLIKKLNKKVEFEWSLKWSTTQIGTLFEKKFEKYWKKTINLNIYSKEDNKKKLLASEDISIFVYTNKTPLIFDLSLWKKQLQQYKEKSRDSWIYIEEIISLSLKEIEKQNISQLIAQLDSYNSTEWNYINIWWNKEFLSWILSKINKEREWDKNKQLFNIVLISPFNTDVLQNYLRNFLSNKTWIQSILLIPESSISQIIYKPDRIDLLEASLKEKQYEYVNINTKTKISQYLFISQFINTLSNKWFPSNGIFIILLIPFLFTWISILKHLIGLSPIGAIIPIWITLLLFQIWVIPTAIILSILIVLNLLLSKVTNRYTLLYTPKISFIITINIVVIMVVINFLFKYNLLESSISDIIFIILFVVISERLITVILSKEFSEYRFNLLNTLLFSLFTYLLFKITLVQTFILAYPEMILILIPINFFIWRFTGLRITEYFRFREVIKSIEE